MNSANVQERWYYTDDGFAAYVSASEFGGLSREKKIACIVRWFQRMYEDPAQQMPHDSEEGGYIYIWGGPYEARDEIGDEFGDFVSEEVIDAAVSDVERDGTFCWAPTDNSPKHTGGTDENGEDGYEPVPPTLGDIEERLKSGVTPTFGDPIETRNRKALRNGISRLRDAIEDEQLRHGGIGHNRPPESKSLSADQTGEVSRAVNKIDEETARPVPNVEAVVESTGRLHKVLGWVRRKLDLSVDSFMKTLGTLVAGGVVAGFVGFPLLEHIARVYRAVLEWLDVVLPLF